MVCLCPPHTQTNPRRGHVHWRLLLVLAAAAFAGAQDFSAKAAAYVESWARDGQFRGAVLVAKEGQPVFRKGFGLANAEWNIPNAPDTRFRLGSITKQFTAVAVLQLMEKGNLSLDDPISKYATDAPASWAQITIRHLLNHTSGIPSYTGLPGFFAKHSRDPLSPVEIIKLTSGMPLEFDPGTKFNYNNTGYIVLGALIEKLSGQKYADYVRQHLLDPAGMSDTGYDDTRTVLARRASGYAADGTNARYLDMSLPYAAGSLYSTVDDLIKWERALATNKLISQESFALMTTPGLGDYGFGLVMRPVAGRKAQAHTGGINGFNTYMARFPEEHLAVVVLGNQESGAPQKIGTDLARLWFGEDVQPRPLRTAIQLPAERLDAIAGKYQIAPNFVLTVWRDGSRLLTQATGQGVVEIFPLSEKRFFAKGVDAEIEAQSDAAGKVNGVTLHQNGKATPAKRLD